MNVLLLQLDGKLPNLALMRVAAHHRALGDHVVLRRSGNKQALQARFDDPAWGMVYGSLIFKSTEPLAKRVLVQYPHAELGGTGWSLSRTLADVGIEGDLPVDYADYPLFKPSIGFAMRGCRLQCTFCVVPEKEGKARPAASITQIWRGGDHPRQILLLDNDFFGNPQWSSLIDELRAGAFRVCFTQGINARALNNETAAAIASVDYRDSNMREKRIYTAWDSIGHEKPLLRGLEALVKHGVKPDQIMVYMLIGHTDSPKDREHRRATLRAFGARPYPMPFTRTPDLVGFQRWVIGAYDKRVPWEQWMGARYSPRRLGDRVSLPLFPDDPRSSE